MEEDDDDDDDSKVFHLTHPRTNSCSSLIRAATLPLEILRKITE
jgi:hypothetical protein